MRFLIDNALSPALADLLTRAAHDALHVRAIQLQHAADTTILERAASDQRVVVTADTDFGTLLEQRSAAGPSVIQFRGEGSKRPEALADALLSNLPQIQRALEEGSVVTFEPHRIRIRALPIRPSGKQ